MDPTECKRFQTTSSCSTFSSISRDIRPISQYSKARTSGSHHLSALPRGKASDPPRLDVHLQARAMTVSADSAPSKPKSKHSLYQSQQRGLRQQQQEGSPSIKEMDKKRVVKSRDARRVFDGMKTEEGDKRLVLVDAGRRSFCESDVEVGCFLATAGARILAKDMPPFMQIHAVGCARKTYDGLEKFSSKALAFTLKKEFDTAYGPAWHCIVGTSFGSFVTHSVGGFLYFSIEKVHILLFKTTVRKAD